MPGQSVRMKKDLFGLEESNLQMELMFLARIGRRPDNDMGDALKEIVGPEGTERLRRIQVLDSDDPRDTASTETKYLTKCWARVADLVGFKWNADRPGDRISGA